MVKSIPIRNKHKDIVAYTKVDDDVYEEIKNKPIHLSKDGYPSVAPSIFSR